MLGGSEGHALCVWDWSIRPCPGHAAQPPRLPSGKCAHIINAHELSLKELLKFWDDMEGTYFSKCVGNVLSQTGLRWEVEKPGEPVGQRLEELSTCVFVGEKWEGGVAVMSSNAYSEKSV